MTACDLSRYMVLQRIESVKVGNMHLYEGAPASIPLSHSLEACGFLLHPLFTVLDWQQLHSHFTWKLPSFDLDWK